MLLCLIYLHNYNLFSIKIEYNFFVIIKTIFIMKTELLFLEGIDRDITFYIGRNQNENFNVINIGTGKSYSVKEVIGIIQAALGTNTKILSSNERRPGEVMDTQADILNAQKILGWLPVWTLEQGIAKMIETYKK